jgi:hypothetical protein
MKIHGGTWRRVLLAVPHLVISFGMMLVLSLVEGLLFLGSKESNIPSIDVNRRPGDGAIDISVRHVDELSLDTLRSHIQHSEPIIIKGMSPDLFGPLDSYAPPLPPTAPGDKLLIDQFTLPRLGVLSDWIREYTGKRVAYMARFCGGYAGGFAHIDSFPSYNFYYVKKGRKKVYIVPRQYNSLLDLANGYDSVFVKNDTADESQMEWLQSLPAYYQFEVEQGDVLLFNNSACIHKFMNLTEDPIIYTVRLFSGDASPLTLKNDVFNWQGAKYFGSILLNPTSVRDTYSV